MASVRQKGIRDVDRRNGDAGRPRLTARRCDAADLEVGGGLDVLVSATLETLRPGSQLDVTMESRAAALELPGWARVRGHDVLDEWRDESGRWVVRLERGEAERVLAPATGRDDGPTPPLRADGSFSLMDWRATVGDPPADAPADAGLGPIGSTPERGRRGYSWRRNRRDKLWAREVGRLTERARRAQWDATTDIPWAATQGLRDDVDRAVAQVATYLAQNEYAAYYIPARFMGDVNPHFPEILMWLAGHVYDEARHMEVFTKRALLARHRAYALDSTERSLETLMEEGDFTSSALLLNVLGEGTFLDLLWFLTVHAPDRATETACRLARRDERRHVSFGIAHLRRAGEHDPDLQAGLIAAAERRASKLADLSGLHPLVTESLTVLAARGRARSDLADAAAAVRALQSRMDENRTLRLQEVGFDAPTARELSDLHTPNLM